MIEAGRELSVKAQLHTLRPDDIHVVRVAQGASVQEIVGERAGPGVHVFLAGEEIPRGWWPHVRPKQELFIQVRMQGGSGNKTTRTILMVAVIVASAYTGGAVGASSWGAGWGALAQAGVAIAGSLLVDALVPMAQPNLGNNADSNDRFNALTGQSNQLNQWGVPPVPFGTIRFFPPLAAKPFTEMHGDRQYIRLLLMLGYGEHDALTDSDIIIGDTDASTYDNIEWEDGAIGSLSLYSNDIDEVSVQADLNDFPGGADFATRTTDVDADEISVDIFFPQGLFGLDDSNNLITIMAGFVVKFTPTSGAGSGIWNDVASGFPGLTISHAAMEVFDDEVYGLGKHFRVTANTRAPLRIGIRWKVPTRGQYDVEIDRISGPPYTYAGATVHVSDCLWAVIRTIRFASPCTIPNLKGLALRVESTDRVNGTLNQIAVNMRMKVPVLTGSPPAYVTTLTSNPAWLYLWVLRGAGGANNKPKSLAHIDQDAIATWAADCEAKGLTYNMVVDSATTLYQQLQAIAAAGRASPGGSSDFRSVVQDKDATVPVQVFSPRNSSGFTCLQSFARPPHGLRVQFINPEAGWIQDEVVVLDDGYQIGGKDAHGASAPSLPAATYFETYQAQGATDPATAWKQGRYHLACIRLRVNTYTWNADVENLRCVRGSLVRVNSDVIADSTAAGRIKALVTDGASPPSVISLVLDGEVTLDVGKTYAVRVRQADGVNALSVITTAAGTTDTVDLATPMTPGSDVASGVQVGDLFVFGISGQESIECFVTRISYAGDLAAQITAVDRAPDIFTADDGTVPAFTSGITGLPWCAKPLPPDISVFLFGSVAGKTVSGGTSTQVPTGDINGGGIADNPPMATVQIQ